MTPYSIILLDQDTRLDVLMGIAHEECQKAKAADTDEAWDKHVEAWLRLQEELMGQLNKAKVSTQDTDK